MKTHLIVHTSLFAYKSISVSNADLIYFSAFYRDKTVHKLYERIALAIHVLKLHLSTLYQTMDTRYETALPRTKLNYGNLTFNTTS